MNEPGDPADSDTFQESWDRTEPAEPYRNPTPLEAAKKVALAGIGAVVVATEATDEVFNELVKRGERTREEAAREINEARVRGAERRAGVTGYVRSRMDSMLNKFNLPSKGDVDSVNAKLNILTRKVDEVQASQVEPTGKARRSGSPPVEPPSEEPPL